MIFGLIILVGLIAFLLFVCIFVCVSEQEHIDQLKRHADEINKDNGVE